jgi:hypothetical protein
VYHHAPWNAPPSPLQITSVIVAQLQERADAEERARKGRERAAKLLGVQLGGVIVSG